jgi:hypothetical protein
MSVILDTQEAKIRRIVVQNKTKYLEAIQCPSADGWVSKMCYAALRTT